MKVALSTHNIFHVVVSNRYLCNGAIGYIPNHAIIDTDEDLQFNPNKKCKNCWRRLQEDILAYNTDVYIL